MKKKQLLSALLALAMLLALLPAAALADEDPPIYDVYQGDRFYITVTPYKLNSTRYRLCGSNANELHTFHDGYVFVETANVDENYVNRRFITGLNLADKDGNIVLPEDRMYYYASDGFLSYLKGGHYIPSEGLIPFWDGETMGPGNVPLMGYMDYQGNVVIPCQYEYEGVYSFHDGLARVPTRIGENPAQMFIDKTGRQAFGPQSAFLSECYSSGLLYDVDFKSGLATYGYLDTQGNMALPLVTEKTETSGDYWKQYAEGQLDGYLMPYNRSWFSDDGYAVVYDLRSGDELAYAYAIIDTSGNVVGTFRDMEPYFSSDSKGFCEGLLRVTFIDNRGNSAGHGYIDTSGNVVLREGELLSGGLYAGRDYHCGVTVAQGGAVIDKKGDVVIPAWTFDSGGYMGVYDFSDNLAMAYSGTQPYLLEIHQGTYSGPGTVYNHAKGGVQTTTPAQPETPAQPSQPSGWAQADVTAAAQAGLVPENLRGSYTQATTRAEFCALAVALYETVTGKEVEGRTTFSDTSDVNVEKAAYLGVVNGIGDGKFGPEGTLTREQAAAMLSRLARAVGKPLAEQAPTFADSGSFSNWAAAAVGQMQASGVMGGVGNNTFAPQGDYSREQSIVTIKRLFELVK